MTTPDLPGHTIAGVTATLVARLDGSLVPPTMAMLRPDDLGVLRGDGVFETTLVIDGVPRDLPEHLARLAVSASMIDLTIPSAEEWQPAIDAVLAGWAAEEDMTLRLIATRGPETGEGPTCYVLGSGVAASTVQQRSGTRIVLLDRGLVGSQTVKAPWLLAGAKTISYAMNMAAIRYAQANGADDAVFIGADGAVMEGPTATVVVARKRTLLTPPRDGILDGITVRRLFAAAEAAGWQTAVAPLSVDDLKTADGFWVASSVRMLAPVISIDGVERPIGPQHNELMQLLGVPASWPTLEQAQA